MDPQRRLPSELLGQCLIYSPTATIARAGAVNSNWRSSIQSNPVLYRNLDLLDFSQRANKEELFNLMDRLFQLTGNTAKEINLDVRSFWPKKERYGKEAKENDLPSLFKQLSKSTFKSLSLHLPDDFFGSAVWNTSSLSDLVDLFRKELPRLENLETVFLSMPSSVNLNSGSASGAFQALKECLTQIAHFDSSDTDVTVASLLIFRLFVFLSSPGKEVKLVNSRYQRPEVEENHLGQLMKEIVKFTGSGLTELSTSFSCVNDSSIQEILQELQHSKATLKCLDTHGQGPQHSQELLELILSCPELTDLSVNFNYSQPYPDGIDSEGEEIEDAEWIERWDLKVPESMNATSNLRRLRLDLLNVEIEWSSGFLGWIGTQVEFLKVEFMPEDVADEPEVRYCFIPLVSLNLLMNQLSNSLTEINLAQVSVTETAEEVISQMKNQKLTMPNLKKIKLENPTSSLQEFTFNLNLPSLVDLWISHNYFRKEDPLDMESLFHLLQSSSKSIEKFGMSDCFVTESVKLAHPKIHFSRLKSLSLSGNSNKVLSCFRSFSYQGLEKLRLRAGTEAETDFNVLTVLDVVNFINSFQSSIREVDLKGLFLEPGFTSESELQAEEFPKLKSLELTAVQPDFLNFFFQSKISSLVKFFVKDRSYTGPSNPIMLDSIKPLFSTIKNNSSTLEHFILDGFENLNPTLKDELIEMKDEIWSFPVLIARSIYDSDEEFKQFFRKQNYPPGW